MKNEQDKRWEQGETAGVEMGGASVVKYVFWLTAGELFLYFSTFPIVFYGISLVTWQ